MHTAMLGSGDIPVADTHQGQSWPGDQALCYGPKSITFAQLMWMCSWACCGWPSAGSCVSTKDPSLMCLMSSLLFHAKHNCFCCCEDERNPAVFFTLFPDFIATKFNGSKYSRRSALSGMKFFSFNSQIS